MIARLPWSAAAQTTTGSLPGHNSVLDGPYEGAPDLPGRGSVLGRYILLSVLGQGGMGVVYSAYDPELERKLALKVVRPGRVGGGEWQLRLMREAQTMARVHHPNVIAVHDVGTVGNEVFVAMPLVEGGTLRGWLAARQRAPEDVLAVFIQAGRGLAAAHAAGVIHRDFKPENVLCGEFLADVPRRVIVTDFGLARSMGRAGQAGADETDATEAGAETSGGASAVLTATGVVMGTPSFMSPEQAVGGELDTRSDQFSFGVALFEALHGVPPHERPKPIDPSTWRPSTPTRSPSLPTRVRRAMLRAVAIAPDERFPDMAALLHELAPARRFGWPHALLVAGVVAIAALVLALGRPPEPAPLCTGGQTRLAAVYSPADAAAIRAQFAATDLPFALPAAETVITALDAFGRRWVDMHAEACAATQVRGEQSEEVMDLRMACLDTRLSQARTLIAAMKGATEPTVLHAAAALGGLAELDACADIEGLRTPAALPASIKPAAASLRARLAEAVTLRYLVQMPESQAILESAVDEARALGNEVLLAEALFEQGDFLVFIEQYPVGEQALRAALLAADASGHDDIRVRAMAQLAAVSASDGTAEAAQWWLDSARAALRRRPSASLSLSTAMPLGTALYLLSPSEARTHFEAAYREAQQVYGPSDARTLELGLAMLELGALGPEDDPIIENITAICQHSWGEAHPCASLLLNLRGRQALYAGRCEDARRMLVEAHDHQVRAVGAWLPSNHISLAEDAAAALVCLGETREALALLEPIAAVDGVPACVAAAITSQLARAHDRLGDGARALVLASAAEDACAEGSIRTITQAARGWILLHRGRAEEALAVFQEATVAASPDDDGKADTLRGAGEARLTLGQAAAAIAPLELALELSLTLLDARDPFAAPETRLALGRALWDSDADHCRARREVGEVAATLTRYQGERARAALDDALRWLRTHEDPRCAP